MGWELLEEEIVISSQLSAETVEAAEDYREETETSSSIQITFQRLPKLPQEQEEAWWATALKQHAHDLGMAEVNLVSACSGMLTEAHVLKDRRLAV